MREQPGRGLRAVLLGTALYCIGMAVAAGMDLSLDQALYRPQNPVAIAFESFGFYPLYLAPLLWVALALREKKRAVGQRVLGSAVMLGGIVGLYFYSCHYLLKRAVPFYVLMTAGVWAVLLALYLALLRRLEVQALRKLRFVLGWGALYAAANTVLINGMKLIWQRTRFDDMMRAGSVDAFTPWYQVPGNGGSSFPSGHTAAACGIFVLVLLCDVLPAWNARRGLVWSGCWVYIAGMALNRIIIGRHYLSDTLTAAFVSALLLAALLRLGVYRRSVQAVCAASSKPQTP